MILSRTEKLTYLSMLTAMAFILSYIEMLIPSPIPSIPGIKLGMANIIILFGIFNLKKSEAFLILAVRLILNALLFGNFTSLLYSAAGGILSFFAMNMIKMLTKKEITVSICGGIFHNIGQLCAAFFILKSAAVFSYIPYLTIAGIIAGAVNGFLVYEINKRLKN